MKTEPSLLPLMTCAWILGLACALTASAQEKSCLACHAKVVHKKTVHAAVHNKGCEYCHALLDASTEPHKSQGKTARGLAAEPPALCNKCHERALFQGKVVHGPVVSGACLKCHNPHASDHLGLLKMEPATLCLDCHSDIKKGPHVIAGLSRGGHPLGNDKKEAQDPLRPGKKFYCAACHEPHRSELPKLTRFGKGMASCQRCHKM